MFVIVTEEAETQLLPPHAEKMGETQPVNIKE
jgi:hypothetical protein